MDRRGSVRCKAGRYCASAATAQSGGSIVAACSPCRRARRWRPRPGAPAGLPRADRHCHSVHDPGPERACIFCSGSGRRVLHARAVLVTW